MELDLLLGSDRVDGVPGLEVREANGAVLIGTSNPGGPAQLDRADVKILYLSLKYWLDLNEEN